MRVFFMRHIQGESRHQATLLPDTLDDYVAEDHPARVIDAWVDSLDMVTLGFALAQTKDTGRKPYHPGDVLKLYLYGYLNQVRSTRRLERECHRNLEVLWLMKRLAPDFKTIANFRQQNRKALKAACRAFVEFCRKAELLTGALIAIDGSKFRAAASKDRAMTRKQLRERQKRLDRLVERYLEKLDQADKEDQQVELDRERVTEALERLKQRRKELAETEKRMDQDGRNQDCSTESEARLMRSGREGVVVGYNVQAAVDRDTGLIVHHEVTDEGTDYRQLQPMAEASKAILERDELEVVADAGYSNGEQLASCEAQAITATVPPKRAKNNQGDYFQKGDFHYDAERNCFICPAGQELHYKTHSNKDKLHLYTRRGCSHCPLQPKCTKADQRQVSRHFYEEAFERCEARLQANPELMKTRMAVVERPFAVLKQLLGLRRFACWGMAGANSEMALGVLSYNLSRLINQVGVERLLKAL